MSLLINTNRCLYWQVIDFKNTISFDRKQENRQTDLIKGESCLYFPSKLVPMNFVTMGHQKKKKLISQRHRSRRLSELCNRGFQHWSSLQTNWLFSMSLVTSLEHRSMGQSVIEIIHMAYHMEKNLSLKSII